MFEDEIAALYQRLDQEKEPMEMVGGRRQKIGCSYALAAMCTYWPRAKI